MFVSAPYGAGIVVTASPAAGTPGNVSTQVQLCNPTDGTATAPGTGVKLVLISG